MRRPAHLLAAAALVAAAALGAPASAQALDCNSLPNLTDPAGFEWSFDNDMDASSANFDGIDNSGAIYYEPTYYHFYLSAYRECSSEDGAREYVYPVQDLAGLEVSGKVYVPASGLAFVRHLWIVRNTTAFPRPLHLIRWNQTDGGVTTDVLTSSSGDEAITPADEWFSWNNSADATDPADAYVFEGSGALRGRTSVASYFDPCCEQTEDPIEDGFTEPQARYEDFDVAPGETVTLMTFLVVRDDAADVEAAARQLAAGDPQGLAGLSDDEKRALRNFTLPDHDGDGVANEADDCVYVANADQANADGDGQGDACDADDDNDGVPDAVEAQRGTDPRKADTDGDGKPDNADACPFTASALANGCPAFDQATLDRLVYGQVKPRSSSAKVSPKRDRKAPFRFRASGTVLPPDGLSMQEGCGAGGRVELRVKKGKRTLGLKRGKLRSDCTYDVSVKLRGRRGGPLRLVVRFGGNKFLAPVTIRSVGVRAGGNR